MKLKYKFNLKVQLAYGIFAFLLSLGILYLFLKQLDWITASIVGIANFIISGYYTTNMRCKTQ